MLRWTISCFMALLLVVLSSCDRLGLTAGNPTSSPISENTTTATNSPKADPSVAPKVTNAGAEDPIAKLPQLKGAATVEMQLKGGKVTMEIDGKSAPVTAGNFIDLVKRGVYNGLTFHRVVKEPSPFVAQGGDPLGNGTGSFIDPATSQPRYIPLEILPEGSEKPVYGEVLPLTKPPKLRHSKGAVAMARSQIPNSASSQFYITLADAYFLDGSYAVFGYVTSGMDIVDKIQIGDRIESMKVVKGLENLKVPG